jgi:hypothetical protein
VFEYLIGLLLLPFVGFFRVKNSEILMHALRVDLVDVFSGFAMARAVSAVACTVSRDFILFFRFSIAEFRLHLFF